MTLQINRTILFAVLLTAAASTDCSWAADESGPRKPDDVKDLERVEVSASRVRKEYSKIFFNFGGTPRFRTVSSYGRQIVTASQILSRPKVEKTACLGLSEMPRQTALARHFPRTNADGNDCSRFSSFRSSGGRLQGAGANVRSDIRREMNH